MGPQYFSHFFPHEEIQQNIRDVQAVLSRQDQSEVLSFFQRVRPAPDADFQWFFTSMKMLKRQGGTEKAECAVAEWWGAYFYEPSPHSAFSTSGSVFMSLYFTMFDSAQTQ